MYGGSRVGRGRTVPFFEVGAGKYVQSVRSLEVVDNLPTW